MAIVIAIGTDKEFIDAYKNHISKWFLETLKINVVAKKSFYSKSELKGNYNDIFDNKLNPSINEELEKVANKMSDSLEAINGTS